MTKIIQRHDTSANWTAANPVLAAGEMGVETDTAKFKFGDGTTAWSDLAYAAGEGGGGSGTTLTSTDGATTYSKLALGNTLAVMDGTLNANLDELGNEVNTLANTVSILETSVKDKQDKLTALDNLVIKKELAGSLDLIWNNGSSILNPIPNTITFGSDNKTYTHYPFYNQYLSNGDIILNFKFIHNMAPYKSSSPKLKYSWANNRGYIGYYIGTNSEPTAYFDLVMVDSTGVSRNLLSKGCSVTDGKILNISFVWRKTTGNWSLNIYNDSGTLLNSASGTSAYTYSDGITLDNTPILESSLGSNNGEFVVYPNTFRLSTSDVESTNIYSKSATATSLGIVQPDGTTITVNESGVISGQDVKTFSGYSDTGTLVLKSINGVLQWVAE